jgi:hypothetical protein
VLVSESKSFEDLKTESKPNHKKQRSAGKNDFKTNEKEESLDYTANANDSIAGGWITGNFGGTFSNFKYGTDSKRDFSSFRASNNIEKLIKKFEIDVKDNSANHFKNLSRDPKNHRSNSSQPIHHQLIIFEEEKRMKDEKHKVADSINYVFRKYEKFYSKVSKKQTVKEEFLEIKKGHSRSKDIMLLFEKLCKNISKDNPNNAITLIKLWKHNEIITQSVFKKLNESKKQNMEAINKHVNEIMIEWSNIFAILDSRNQDILSLIEYIGDVNKMVHDRERKEARVSICFHLTWSSVY